jgi:hypothetical protein
MYAAVDPFYMVMLIRILGADYIVWDKSASIQFKRPGRSTLRATFTLDDEEIESVRTELTQNPAVDRVYHTDLAHKDGVVCASVMKTIYIRRKEEIK